MNPLLVVLVLIFAVALCVLIALQLSARKKLSYYQRIHDIENYQVSCEAKATAALQRCQTLTTQSNSLTEYITAQQQKVGQYQQLLGNLKSAAELRQRIEQDTARVQQLSAALGGLERATQLSGYIQSQNAAIQSKQAELESLSTVIGSARSITEVAAQAKYFENYLAQLKADVEAVEETKTMHEFGFYRPRYQFDTSDLFQDRLDQVRERQKSMLSNGTACMASNEWTVNGSKTEGKKMVDKQTKLMLRAFNGECDAAMGKVRYNNVVSLENRIRRSFEQINKLGETQQTSMSVEFCDLKFQELQLGYEFQLKLAEEKEEQRAIREQMREEEKIAKETEKACEAAAREESVKSKALEQAREELALSNGRQTERLAALVSKLETELHAAIDRKAKAIARAQLTKSGHVYILSNLGTFGEGVYKIGMSRRLEPLDRVDELGGASVPFPFDVHAMIYSENAPELECALHRHFANRRLNLINLRREFFRVTLDEIRAAVAQHFGQVTFLLVPEAEQYRQTLAKLKDLEREQLHLQIA